MLDNFYTDAEKAVETFDAFVRGMDFAGKGVSDHICYKCDSREEFVRMREQFEYESEFIFQSIISGRPIAVIKLKHPVPTILGDIYTLELSDQKPDGSQKSGFDHIEVAPLGMSYDEAVTYFEEKGNTVIAKVRPHHSTHDIALPTGFIFRLTHGPLIEKIRDEEMD